MPFVGRHIIREFKLVDVDDPDVTTMHGIKTKEKQRFLLLFVQGAESIMIIESVVCQNQQIYVQWCTSGFWTLNAEHVRTKLSNYIEISANSLLAVHVSSLIK